MAVDNNGAASAIPATADAAREESEGDVRPLVLPTAKDTMERAGGQNEKNAPGVGAEVTVYSSGKSALEGNGLAKTLASSLDKISDMQPVYALQGTELNDRSKKPSEQIRSLFSKIGSVVRNGFGTVSFGEYGVGSILTHRPLNRAKMVSLTAVPEVIKNGRIISDVEDWKGRGYRSVIFAAPATIAETPVYIAAVVNQNPDGKFYLNEVVDTEGNYMRIEDSPLDDTKSGVTAQGGVTATPEEPSSETTVPQRDPIVKNEVRPLVLPGGEDLQAETEPESLWEAPENREDTVAGDVRPLRLPTAESEAGEAKAQEAQRIGQMVGRRVEFYDGADPDENGYFDRASGVIHINRNSQNPMAQVISHELTHSLEQTDSYQKLQELVLSRVQAEGGDLERLRAKKAELYARHGHELRDTAAIDYEIVAEYVEKNLLTDEQRIREVVRQDRTLGQTIMNWLDRVLAGHGAGCRV